VRQPIFSRGRARICAGVFFASGLALCGCGRYADFTLPPPDAGGPGAPFQWRASPQPQIEPGPDWDASDVLNPSVVRIGDRYLNLYSGFDGHAWHTGRAISDDGQRWQKLGRVLSPGGWEGDYIAANGSALVVGQEIFYWYEAGRPLQIGLARSRDGGATWTKHPNPVVPPGPRGSFDERAVADPYVIRRGDFFFLFYLGQDRAARQRLGVARSRDGVGWEKLRSNPVLELGAPGAFDEAGLGEPAVWSSGGSYWMLYTGRDREEHRRMGLARSADGVRWERDTSLSPITGSEAWNRQVVCDPSVEVTDRAIRVWFGGGDVARPDQGIHGRIGMGMLTGARLAP